MVRVRFYPRGKDKEAAQPRPEKYLGQRANRGLYLLVALLILLLVTISTIYYLTLANVRQELADARGELEQTRAERDQLSRAYETAVADAQAFSRMYDITYAANASANASGDASAQPLEAKQLPALDVWDYYAKQGRFKDDCIPTTKVVQSQGDAVEISVAARGVYAQAWPRMTIVVDGTPLATFDITKEESVYRSVIALPKGKHHLDLVFTNAYAAGPLTVSLVRIGDRTIENERSVIDDGDGFSMFDCEETKTGDTLSKTGAMRFKFERI